MRRNLPLAVALLFLGCVVLGSAALPGILRERRLLILLQNHMERSAAPDEPVLVDDRWLAMALNLMGSKAATRRAVFVREGDVHLSGPEAVLVARPQDALLRSLRAAGYTEIPDSTGSPWDETGDGSALWGCAAVRIYFVTAPRR